MTRTETLMTVGGILAGANLLVTVRRPRRAIDFEGHIALITGGSRGLGLLIADELGRLGAQVTIVVTAPSSSPWGRARRARRIWA